MYWHLPVYAIVGAGTAPALRFSLVDLSVAPNPGASPTEANFDPKGSLLVKRVASILEENKGGFQRCVVALDAPLEASHRAVAWLVIRLPVLRLVPATPHDRLGRVFRVVAIGEGQFAQQEA